jgi:glucose-6-phosphate 1-epimerase
MAITLPAAAQLITLGNDLTLLQLDSGSFCATLSLLGGQLLSFQPYGQQPWLYMSPQAVLQPGKAIRGGVPVCWPWFGRTRRHLTPRPTAWRGSKAGSCCRGAGWRRVSRETARPAMAGLSVQLDYTLADHIAMQLHTHNNSTQAHTVSAALHSYLAVSDSRSIRLEGLEDTVSKTRWPRASAACHPRHCS